MTKAQTASSTKEESLAWENALFKSQVTKSKEQILLSTLHQSFLCVFIFFPLVTMQNVEFLLKRSLRG